MTGKDRREDILNTIKILEKPISGTELAEKLLGLVVKLLFRI